MNNYTETTEKMGILQSSISIRNSLKEKINDRKKIIFQLQHYIRDLIYENDQAMDNLYKFEDQIKVLQEDLSRQESDK